MQRRLAAAGALSVALVLSGLAPVLPASAEPTAAGDLTGRVADPQSQLDFLNEKAKVARERYNASRIELARAAEGAAAAGARAAAAADAVRRQQALVGTFASAAYREGSTQQAATLTAMAGTADLQSFLAGMSALDAVARRQREALDGLAVARHGVEVSQAATRSALAGRQRAADRVGASKAALEADVARMQHLLGGLQAQQADVVRQAEAAAARAAAEQQSAAVRLAAEQAAAAARARQAALAAQAAAVAGPTVVPTAPTIPAPTIPAPAVPRVVAPQPPPAPVPVPVAPPRGISLNWAALAQCESGGDPTQLSYGGLYRGLYQFTFGTWASVGGIGDPAAASPAEQTYRAQLLYNREGRTPWPVCGKYL